MGICGSADEKAASNSGAVTDTGKISVVKKGSQIYGDFIDPDTRTLLAAFSLGGIKH